MEIVLTLKVTPTYFLVWEVLQTLLAGLFINVAQPAILISFVFVNILTRLQILRIKGFRGFPNDTLLA